MYNSNDNNNNNWFESNANGTGQKKPLHNKILSLSLSGGLKFEMSVAFPCVCLLSGFEDPGQGIWYATLFGYKWTYNRGTAASLSIQEVEEGRANIVNMTPSPKRETVEESKERVVRTRKGLLDQLLLFP